MSGSGQHGRRSDRGRPRGHDSRLERLPALDGVRGLAVAAVLAFQGGLNLARGGFLGVDAFFVLSGYLITTLLLREWDSAGRIRLGAFWMRRARRLLPALLVAIAAVVIAGRAVLPPEEVALLRGDALATLGYVANWRMIHRGGDYFTQTASPSLLQHAWSLGIEEQFYVLLPLLLVGLMVWGRINAWNRLLREFAAAHPTAVTVVDLGGRVTPGGEFSWSVSGIRMRSDGLHFTAAGVRRWISPWLTPNLVAASE